jgi:hypothetical protein
MMPKALAAVLTVCCWQAAHAASRDVSLAGDGLSVDSPCARHVDIRPDPALHGQVAVTASADRQEELDRLVIDTRRGRAQIHTVEQGCWRPALDFSFTPTLTLVVRVPVAMPIAIDESGAGEYTIGDVGGGLELDLSGAAKVGAQHAADFATDISGDASVTVAKAEGKGAISISGHGSVAVGEARMPALSVDLSGAGSVSIGNGHIGHATLDESGFGSIRIGGEVDDAKVDLSGAGSVHFAKVNGALEKDVSGAGNVSVGD